MYLVTAENNWNPLLRNLLEVVKFSGKISLLEVMKFQSKCQTTTGLNNPPEKKKVREDPLMPCFTLL